ncbi:hypothetical protein B7P43_G18103 [Cryptotermes secundus]|uniref:Uncharacterized protein n=2 Tax=Cryptotermes secundus TaxID=105785 RepID=A0A2J7PPB7_9NEOP|nr:hypothetical protein B7P43_G18103 [Cryptotermes secundus]
MEQEEIDEEARKQRKRKIDAGEDTREGTAEPSHLERKDDSKKDTEQEEDVKMSCMVTCPLYQVPKGTCIWDGDLRDLKKHVTGTHTDILRTGWLLSCNSLQSKVLLILYNEEIFLYYKCCDMKQGMMYVAVQQAGITNSKYRYRVEFFALEAGVRNITYSFRTHSTRESIQDIFDTRRCVALDVDRLKPFIINNELHMTVKLNEINSRGRSDVAKGKCPTGDDSNVYSEQGKSDSEAEEKELEMSSTVTCPMSKIPQQMCFWVGMAAKLEEHVVNTHADVSWRGPVVGYNSLNADALLILFNKEIFLYHRYISKSGIMYVTVQKVGMTNQKYTYTMEATATDKETDMVTFNFRIKMITEPFKDVFHSRKCVVISADQLKLLIKNKELNMLLRISVHEGRVSDVTEADSSIGHDSTISPKKEPRDSDIETEFDRNFLSTCPLLKIAGRRCAWVGTVGKLEQHVIQTHAEIVRRHPFFSCSAAEDNVLLILLHKEVFLYCRHISDTGMYAIVQKVGITNREYTCRVVLVSVDNWNILTFGFPVSQISKPFQELLDAGKCLAINKEHLEQFTLNDKIGMFVAIKVVTDGRLAVAGEERKSVGTSHQRRKREAPQDSDSTIICPVSKIPERRCNWVGTLDSLRLHFTCEHWGIYRSGPIFRCGSFQNKVLLILFNQEVFLYYKHVTHTGIVYAVVQQVGVTNKEFKYTIKLRAEDETVENITFSFKTEKTSEPLEIIFDARRCMAMTDESLIPFVVKHELNMTVKISETDAHGDRPTVVTKGVNMGKKKKMRPHQEEKAGSVAKGDVKTTSAVTCPLLKIPQYSCDWAGSLEDLEAHVIRDHASILEQSYEFECGALEHKVLLILLNKEIFLYCKYTSPGGVTYVIVQQVGVTREKYRYAVSLCGDQHTDHIMFEFDVNEIAEPLGKAFESGKCLAIRRERLQPYIRGDWLVMVVKIQKVLTRAQTEGTHMNSAVTCPLLKVSEHFCTWVGKLGNLEEHVEDEHGDVLSRGCTFGCDSLTNKALLVLAYDEIFLYYKYISQISVMYVIVQQVGLTNRKYGYAVELNANNDEDDIVRDFNAYKITEPFGPTFNYRTCMVIPIDNLGPYIENGKLAMSVGIHEIHYSAKDTVESEPDESEPDDSEADESESDVDFDGKEDERLNRSTRKF